MAATAAIGAARLKLPDRQADAEPIPVASIVRLPAVGACAAAVVVAAATISMLEPVLALQLESLGVNPGRVGIVFGVAALASAGLHPVAGRLADRLGARRLTLWGLVVFAAVLPILGLTWNFESAIVFYVIQAAAMALVIAPSVAYMGDAVSAAGIGSFGVAYGLYNVAWGAGLLGGPAVGGVSVRAPGIRTSDACLGARGRDGHAPHRQGRDHAQPTPGTGRRWAMTLR